MDSVVCQFNINGILNVCGQIGQYKYVKKIYFLSIYYVVVFILIFKNIFLVIFEVFNLDINEEKIIYVFV